MHQISDENGIKIIYCREKIDCEHLLGQFLDESHYDILVNEDSDVYAPDYTGSLGEHNILAKFRKNAFTQEEATSMFENMKCFATISNNRGTATGPREQKLKQCEGGIRLWVTDRQRRIIKRLETVSNEIFSDDNQIKTDIQDLMNIEGIDCGGSRGDLWVVNRILKDGLVYEDYTWWKEWLNENVINANKINREKIAKDILRIKSYISLTTYAESVQSGIMGFFDRFPRFPFARMTSSTEKNLENFKNSFSFLQKLDSYFRYLLPGRYARQKFYANKIDKRFLIPETVFTTTTVNINFRTAAHLDAGDLHDGFSNLIALGHSWDGGYLVLPEYRVAFNVRPGDLLLINNHEGIHGNTEITSKDGNHERMTLVNYFREKMVGTGSLEYENVRKEFVMGKIHRNKENGNSLGSNYNGVDAGMFQSDEWFDFLETKGLQSEDPDYQEHRGINLEDMFG